MEELEEFPFVAGEKVEAKSNIKGYRGAWFRCEIKDIRIRRGEIWCSMQYLDFPDEKVSSTKAYQQDLTGKKRRALMLRPSFPTVCQEFDGSAISGSVGALVVFNGDWQVGDLVDWWSDGCYWGAKIIAVPNRDFVQVELPAAPIGEGGRYEAAVKDIRPYLEWSVVELWTVPGLKFYCDNERGGLGNNQISAGLGCPTDQFESGKIERIFIARQEPLQSTTVRGSHVLDEEAYLKRKAWVLEPDSTSEGRNVPYVKQHSKSCTIVQMENADAQGMPSTALAPPQFGEVKSPASINLPRRLTRTFSGHLGDKTTLGRQISRSQKPGMEISTDFRGAFSFLNKSVGKDQLECLSTECAGELLDLSFLEQDEKRKDNEGKIDQTGQASGLKELVPLTLKFCQHEDGKQFCELCMLSWEEDMGTTSSDTRHLFPNCDKGCDSLSICDQTAGAVSDPHVDTLVGEGKSINVDEVSVASSIKSLEELVSRVVWLKGVLQLGLKGWSQERNKKKWMLCETETSTRNNVSQNRKYGSIDQKSDKTLLEGVLRSSVEKTDQEMCHPADSPRNITEIYS